MTTERWRQIEKVFDAVSDLPADERTSRLIQECGGDNDLQQEVETLLHCDHEDDEFAERAVQGTAEILARETSVSVIGKSFGVYRITRIIGHGGMGAVYEALRDDGQFEQKVAVKLIKRGMETAVDIRRFRRERQILARLDHPNIARLLDGGATPEGSPYLVMEYVEGRPITDYCQEQSLAIEQKLRLILQVAGAVQYAHQKLVVHRDLKPANILVTSDGVPKLLDFGVALLVQPDDTTDASPRTYTTAWLLTPDYASPEQIRGEPVTAASDVYSLGVVLYELLTGKRAHRISARSAAEIERAVCQTDIETPSLAAGNRALRGDLDNILLMALRKEPGRRYSSIDQFAEDIHRCLDGRPVSARKDTLMYRAGKFIRRNRLAIAAAALVMLSLAGGIVATTLQARRAERRFQQARESARTMLFELDERIRNLPGSLGARAFLAEKALQHYDSLAKEAQGDETLQWELAQGYERVGELLGADLRSTSNGPLYPWLGKGLGKNAEALVTLRKALAIEELLLAKHPGNQEYRIHLATLYFNIGTLEPDSARAIDWMQKAIAVGREITPLAGKQERLAIQKQRLLLGLAEAQLRVGDPKQALATFRQSEGGPEGHRGEAAALTAMGDVEGAWRVSERFATGLTPGAVRIPPGTLLHRYVYRFHVLACLQAAKILGGPRDLNLGRRDEALAVTHRALSIAQPLAGIDPNDQPVKQLLSDAYALEAALLQDRNPAQALECARKGIRESPSVAAHAEAALALRSLGKPEEALAELKRALDVRPVPVETAIFIHHQLGDLLHDPAHYRQALDLAEKAVAEKPAMMPLRKALADCYEKLGHFDKSLEIWNTWTKWGVSSPYDQRRRREAEAAWKKSSRP